MLQKLHEIEALQVKQWLEDSDALLIDVREVNEFNEEYIPRAQLYCMSTFSAADIPNSQGKKIIFQCKTGRRATQAATKWADYLGAPDAYVLKGGIEAWKDAGLATHSNTPASQSLQKKAYISAGVLILLGILLAVSISSWFLLLPAATGLFLIFAGLKGISFLSYLFAKIKSKRVKETANL
jgi:rhodanese-related sulfurtransferase